MRVTKSNYYNRITDEEYLSSTQYKDFCGTLGRKGCEARALARLRGEWTKEPTTAMLIGSYVDSYFEKSLKSFLSDNPQMFKKDGTLKAEYSRANDIISRVKKDKLFMKYMSGKKQKIMTAELFGAKWKIKMDSYHPDKCIVDLKIVKDIHERFWVKDYGFTNIVEYWGYDIQGAIYQAIVEKKTGKKLPFFLAMADKQTVTDMEVVGIDNNLLSQALFEIECNTKRIVDIKKGLIEPDRCEECDYCKATKVLKAPIHYSLL